MKRAGPLLLAVLLAACGSAPRRDLDYDRLHASLQALAADPELARLALAERTLAEAAVRRLDASSINAKEHAQLSYLAERRVDIAYIAAQTERENARLVQLQREHAELLLAASRRETEAVRAELDRQRRRELLQQEEAERGGAAAVAPRNAPATAAAAAAAAAANPAPPAAPPPAASAPAMPASVAPSPEVAATPGAADGAASPEASAVTPDSTPETAPVPDSASGAGAGAAAADAAQSAASTVAAPRAAAADAPAADATLAERLAALAPDADGGGRRITLEDLIFEPGTATFAGGAEVGLARVAAWLAAAPAQRVRIEGHTDATGSPEANLSLSLRRAEAVRDALVARGVAAARIVVSGEGGAEPVASNDDAQGRARNRRVVVELFDGG